ncbi:MAG: MFS transporter [Candidatus Scalindua sp.]|jgi:FSR family fosmidomycin resistance protein-like MFS transporter|nr:MFS transporter [Candidatus Scalindua sp.]MBT5307486.1 MFS transporter [Candidatus Scalindua sp.]MBT6046116.1 MFS transporter [Candidatus Scalindua sp.]MBT6565001.1 MFS transporter [Candidatus Scalindua sp.]MBT7212667.1 MFS transporter [Candidatus Scalindua sp.]
MTKNNGKFLSTSIILLTFSHLFNDFYAGFLMPLLSYFQSHLHLSITQVSILPAVLAVFGSILQPVFGFLGDRFNKKLFIVSGVLCSALFMSCIGFAPNFITLIFMLMIGASGVAAFHPNGAATVARLTQNRSTFMMSIFLMVGCIGLAGAPFIITSIVSSGGFNKLWLLSLPGVILALILIKVLTGEHENKSSAKLSDFKILFVRKSRPLWIMFLIMFTRSVVITSFMSFMSILFAERGLTMHDSGIAISTFLICGSIGGLIGGYLADKISRKIIIAGSSIFACPLLLWFLHADGTFSMVLLGLSGTIIFAASAVNVLIVQKLCPDMASSIAGISMGLVWGTAGLMLPVIGHIADHYNMETSLRVAAFMLPIAGMLVLVLPNIDRPAKHLSKE